MAAQDIIIPQEIDTPPKFAKWFDAQLKSLTAHLPDDEAEKIRQNSIMTITDISMKWDKPEMREEAEQDFRDYYRKTQVAIGINADFEEVRELASDPGIVGQVGNLVSKMDATKASLLSLLVGRMGLNGLAEGLQKLSTLEALVTSFSGNSIFAQMGAALGKADSRLSELNGPPIENLKSTAGDTADKLPQALKELLQKNLRLPGAEDPEIPFKPKEKYPGR